MTKFELHTPKTAPEGSRELLETSAKTFGFVPNLYAGLAESPVALKAYLGLSDLLSKSSLSPTEQQVVALTTSVIHECEFCVSAHSTIALDMAKVPAPVVDAIRDGKKLPDPKLESLATFVRAVIHDRGWVSPPVIESFIGAGFTRAQMLDVLLGVSMKTMSNYANHIMQTPVNKEFEPNRWSKDKKAA